MKEEQPSSSGVPEEYPSRYRVVVIGSITSSVAMALAITFILGLLLPDISEDLDLSPSEQGWLGSSVLIGNLILAIPTNLWLSRYRPWRIASLSFLGIGVFTLVQAWSPVFAVLIIGRVGIGLAFIATQAPRALIIQQWTPRRQLTTTNGFVFSAMDLIEGVAFFLTPVILSWTGSWRETLYVWAGVAFFTAFFWIIFGRERETTEYQRRIRSQSSTPLLSIFRYPQLWIMGFGMGGAMLERTAFHVFWPTFAKDEIAISVSLAGSVLGIMSFVTAPTDLLVNIVPSFVRRQPLVLGVCSLAAMGSFIGLLYVESTALILLFAFIKGASFSFFPVLMIMVYHLPDIKPREVAIGVAFMQTSIWIGSAIGPVLVGTLQESTGDLRFALLVTTFTPLILTIAAILLQVRRWEPIQRIHAAATTEG